MKERPLYQKIWQELSQEKPMIFIAGPRQAGKTTFARMAASSFTNQVYFNWDLMTNKKLLVEKPAFFEDVKRQDASPPLVIFDEIHKYRKWKNYLKGIYDQFSGRLNVFQKGGDSLAGRYFLFTLWPMTLAELANRRSGFDEFMKNPLRIEREDPSSSHLWNQLSRLSGFPEPYLSGKETTYRRWAKNYGQQLIREDIRNMADIKNVDAVEILFSLLPSKVGSPFSMLSTARDMQVSFNSIRNWLSIFERFFLIFRISPWSNKISRAITKEKKVYLYDYVRIETPAQRFENMAALELWRAVSNWNDLGLGDFSLYYIRNKQKEEVDFLIVNEHTPKLLIETKMSDAGISKNLIKFQSVLKIPAVQLVNRPGISKLISNGKHQILVTTASQWLPYLP